MQLVIPYHHQPSTTSLLVAQKFGKPHYNVLRDIENLECSPEFRALNFEVSSYRSAQNKEMPMYIMTRDGFTFLVMGFTGATAARFKEEYINEFNRMDKILRSTTPVLIPTYSKRILSEPTKSVPRGFWCVFNKCHSIMLFIEKHIGSINEYDLVDGSIGSRWAAYRKGKPWASENDYYYLHEYDDKRGARDCRCYQNSEAQYFEDWLTYIYKPEYLYNYLHDKYSRDKNIKMLEKVEKVLPPLLK